MPVYIIYIYIIHAYITYMHHAYTHYTDMHKYVSSGWPLQKALRWVVKRVKRN